MDIAKRPAQYVDTDFARSAHHVAYRDVIVRQYGVWEEETQDEFFDNDWNPSEFEIILCDAVPCGYMRVEDRGNDIHVRELVILPSFQGKGIGSQILSDIIKRAKICQVPIRLRTQRANRAVELYLRLGFREVGRTETHILMEWNN